MHGADTLLKFIGDAFSIGALVGVFLHVLPTITAIATLVWTLIRIYETRTVQSLIARFRKNTTA